jgi:hypothetical protein
MVVGRQALLHRDIPPCRSRADQDRPSCCCCGEVAGRGGRIAWRARRHLSRQRSFNGLLGHELEAVTPKEIKRQFETEQREKGGFMSLTVRQYLDRAKGQTIPPLVLELILRSGKSFYIKSVFEVDDKAEMVPLRVWDLRALTQADLDTVLRRLGAVQSRDELENIEKLHPKLDQGNLWVLLAEIEALVEWHSDLWPGVDRPEARQVVVGFRS